MTDETIWIVIGSHGPSYHYEERLERAFSDELSAVRYAEHLRVCQEVPEDPAEDISTWRVAPVPYTREPFGDEPGHVKTIIIPIMHPDELAKLEGE